MSELVLDRAGRRRAPATLPGFHAGHAPGNIASVYLQGIDSGEMMEIVHARGALMIAVSASLRL
jgi:hypothetical protein